MIEARITAIRSSAGRARSALFVATIASATVCVAVWNTYFTWSRHWAALPEVAGAQAGPLSGPQKRFQDLAFEQQVHLFMENKDIDLSLLGIRVSSDDIPILGGLALCLVSLYQLLALRRTNHDIASVLIEAKHLDASEMRLAYFGIQSELMLNATSARERPVESLDYTFQPVDPEQVRIALSVKLLLYLPFIVILLATVSDIYYAVAFPGEFDLNLPATIWGVLPLSLRIELAVLDAFGILICFLTWRYCRASFANIKGTFTLMASFAEAYQNKYGCSIYDPPKRAPRTPAME